MKILIISQYFWPEQFQINTIVLGLKKRGHDVEVLTGLPNYPTGIFFESYNFFSCLREELWNEITIHRIPIIPRGGGSTFRLIINYLSFILSGLFFAPFILRNKNYDVIFVYGVSPIFQSIPASFLGFLKGAPVVLWVQDLWPESPQATRHINSKLLLNIIRLAANFTYRQVNMLLVQSKAFIPILKKSVPDIPIIYHPNTVEPFFYSNNSYRLPAIQSLENDFNVVFAGNIGETQAIEVIVASAIRLKPYSGIKIIMFGGGSRLNWVKQQVKKNELSNLIIEGHYSVEFMPKILRKASALLLTLNSNPASRLTIPNKLQAYLAVGKPIIACLDGEASRIIKASGAGFTVRAEDSKGLFEAILKMRELSDFDRMRMGRNGSKYFKSNYETHKLIDDLVMHLSCVVKKDLP